MAACRMCEFPILWGETANGKKMPLDENPIEPKYAIDDGTGALFSRGQKLYVLIAGKIGRAMIDDRRLHRPLYTCHFETCGSRGG